jgi:hypothetical protein
MGSTGLVGDAAEVRCRRPARHKGRPAQINATSLRACQLAELSGGQLQRVFVAQGATVCSSTNHRPDSIWLRPRSSSTRSGRSARLVVP